MEYPAATGLVHELHEIGLEASRELEAVQAVAAEAAAKLPGDGKGVKDLGVLPRTRQIAADCVEWLAILRDGLPALRWQWPWSSQVCRLLTGV
jgi:hypothetical protein